MTLVHTHTLTLTLTLTHSLTHTMHLLCIMHAGTYAVASYVLLALWHIPSVSGRKDYNQAKGTCWGEATILLQNRCRRSCRGPVLAHQKCNEETSGVS